MYSPEIFRKQLKALRKQSHLSQPQLGEQLQVTGVTIGRWENGNREPSIENLCDLAEYFGVSLDFLVRGEEPGRE